MDQTVWSGKSSRENEEDKITKEYMLKYGIDNVRGGAYVQTELDEAQKAALIAEQKSVTGGCFRCGSSTHWVRNCNKRKRETESEDESESDEDGDSDESEDEENDDSENENSNDEDEESEESISDCE